MLFLFLCAGTFYGGSGFDQGQEGVAMVPETVEEHKAAPAAGATILIVEDEVLIRYDIGEYLRSHGYDVVEANSAAEAIQVLKSSVQVSLVFTDIRMPGTIDGIDLAHYVQTHHPNVPVLVTSGHIPPQELPESVGPLISKPYSGAAVLRIIQEKLKK